MFQKILVGSDGSDCALQAARLAASVARPLNATIILVNAFDLAATTAIYSASPEAFSCTQYALEYGQQAQQEILARTGAVIEEAGIAYGARAEVGRPVETVVHVAKESGTDLIVMGSHGMSGLERFLLGSVSDGVVHHAPCPTLIVRGQASEIHHILVAFDGSAGAEKALLDAASLAAPLHATLTVLNVLEEGQPFPGVSPEEAEAPDYAQRVQQAVIQRVEKMLHGTGVVYRCCRRQGHPAEEIAHFADAEAMDLVVLGSRGLGGFQRLRLGSVSDAVLHHAPCSVLIVR